MAMKYGCTQRVGVSGDRQVLDNYQDVRGVLQNVASVSGLMTGMGGIDVKSLNRDAVTQKVP